jgi:hypothetical protein
MSLIDPGKKAPSFSLPDQDGKQHSLADYAGQPVVDLLLSEGRHARLHQGILRVPGQPAEVQEEQGAVLGISVLNSASKASSPTSTA